MRIKLFLFIAFVGYLPGTSVFSQSFNDLSLSLKLHYGFIADVNYEKSNLIKRHIVPVEINLEKAANCEKNQYYLCSKTRYGLSLYYVNMGNSEILGHLFAPMLYLNTALFQTNKFSANIKAGIGSALVTKKYHPTENYKNEIFSRNVNFAFSFENMYSYVITRQHVILAGLQFNHFSNGETRIPNEGMNNASIFAGYRYNFSDETETENNVKLFQKPSIHAQIIPTIGQREIIHEFGEKFLTSSVSAEVISNVTGLNNVGIGVAAFYDEAYLQKSARQYDTISGFSNKILGGIYLAHEFNFHPLYIVFHAGKFIGNTKLTGGNEYFNRMGIRYFISKKVFFNLTHKSHFFFKGNNIEWGVGVKW